MLLQERYRLLKLISKGGFCKTFLATDEGQSPPVSCIVQELSLPNQTPQLFEQKAQQLKELGKHPQIPALLTYFQDNEYFYLVQEFIEGKNLAQVIEDEGTFNETQIWQLLKDLLPVLQLLRDRNIIHRDIKPVNIILRTVDKNFVLVDFGAAKLVTSLEELTDENSIGSPEYAAPEQAQGKAIFASDLYSLGVTCIYLLTQVPPFDLFDIANNCWVWREYVSDKISDRLGQILDKLIQNAVNQRFQSADEVMEAMGMELKIKNTKLKVQNNSWQCLHTLTGHSNSLGTINALSISPDGNILASGFDDKTIKLWDLNTKKILASLSGHSQAVTSVAFSPNGEILATASDDKTIKLWHVDTLKEIFTLSGHAHAVKSVAFSPNGEILASGSWDKKIKLWDVNTGAEICTFTGHKLQITSVTFSPDGQLLASGSFDKTIRLWNLREIQNHPCNALLGTLSGHTRAVLTVAFSPDGKILATGSDDNTIKLWDLNTDQLIRTLSSHSWSVIAVAFTTDGQTLISGSWDKTVKLWRVNTAEEIVTLRGHLDSVTTFAVNQVAQLIASGSKDKTIKLWQFVEQQES